MIIQKFPDLAWLKNRIQTRQEAGLGWPTCILNVETQQEYRPGIAGPLSIFSNLKGTSYCKVGNHTVRIEPGQYFISNRGDEYCFEIDSKGEAVETMNIHVEEALMEKVFAALVQRTDFQLEQPDHLPEQSLHFYSQLYPKAPDIAQVLDQIRHTQSGPEASKLLLDEQLYQLMTQLLHTHRDVMRDVQRLPAIKASTRTEIYRRLTFARDYIHSHYSEELHLDELAANACMSRFHFLRLFKLAYGQTPYQYLKALRLQKAKEWLRATRAPVGEIALRLGYQNISSFSRVFQKGEGVSPVQFRALIG
ncbi:MAG: AraC family transcriptional regulator [Bacteroidota bacterium]